MFPVWGGGSSGGSLAAFALGLQEGRRALQEPSFNGLLITCRLNGGGLAEARTPNPQGLQGAQAQRVPVTLGLGDTQPPPQTHPLPIRGPWTSGCFKKENVCLFF